MNIRLTTMVTLMSVVLATACAQTSGRPKARTMPAAEQGPRDVHVRAAWTGDDLSVSVEVEGDADGVTHFYVPSLAKNVVLETPGASFLEVEGDDQTAVRHRPRQRLQFAYDIDLPAFDETRPAIVLGADLWFLPWEVDWRVTNATFDLSELSRRAGIHSVETGTVQAIVPRFRRSVHVFGAHSDREVEVAGCRLRVWAEPGANVDVSDAIADGREVLGVLNEFWEGGLPSSHLVVFTDGRPAAAKGEAYLGMAMFQAALISDEAEHPSGEYAIPEVMAHEIAHHFIPWVGVHEQRWVAEGLTDYIGEVVAIRAGVMPLTAYAGAFDYAAWLNDELRTSTLAEDEPAYLRATGFLLAHRWAQRYGHDAVRRWVVAAWRKRATTKELTLMLRDMLSLQAVEDLERAVVKREPLTFQDEGCLRYGEEAYRPGGKEPVRHHVTLTFDRASERDCPFVDGMR